MDLNNRDTRFLAKALLKPEVYHAREKIRYSLTLPHNTLLARFQGSITRQVDIMRVKRFRFNGYFNRRILGIKFWGENISSIGSLLERTIGAGNFVSSGVDFHFSHQYDIIPGRSSGAWAAIPGLEDEFPIFVRSGITEMSSRFIDRLVADGCSFDRFAVVDNCTFDIVGPDILPASGQKDR